MMFPKYFRGLMALMLMVGGHAAAQAQVRYDLASWGEDVKAAKLANLFRRELQSRLPHA